MPEAICKALFPAEKAQPENGRHHGDPAPHYAVSSENMFSHLSQQIATQFISYLVGAKREIGEIGAPYRRDGDGRSK